MPLKGSSEVILASSSADFNMRSSAVAGKVAGISAGGTLAVENAHADGAGAGFFQRLHLAQADERGEFVALADYALGGGRASGHGAADDVLREFAKISFQFLVLVSEFGHRMHDLQICEQISDRSQLSVS